MVILHGIQLTSSEANAWIVASSTHPGGASKSLSDDQLDDIYEDVLAGASSASSFLPRLREAYDWYNNQIEYISQFMNQAYVYSESDMDVLDLLDENGQDLLAPLEILQDKIQHHAESIMLLWSQIRSIPPPAFFDISDDE